MQSTHRPAFAAIAVFLVAACGDSVTDSSDDGPASGAVTGTITFVSDPGALLAEVEPNDGFDAPQVVGPLAPGRAVRIRGAIAAGEGFDGFAFVAPERCRVEASLRLLAGTAPRVQLAAFDPLALEIVAGPVTAGALEFLARGPFDVVVRAPAGAGPYELTVRARPLAGAIVAPGWIGALAVGDSAELAPLGAATFGATCSEALALRVTARGADVSVWAGDRARLATVAAGSEQRVECAPLERISLECAAGGSALVAAEATADSGTALRAPRGDALERAAWGSQPDGPAWGRDVESVRAGELLALPRAGADLAVELRRRGLVETDRVGEDVLQLACDLSAIPEVSARRRATIALARSLAASGRVEYAEPNRIRRAFGTPPFAPDDQYFGLQWHYPLVRLPEAWAEVQDFVTAPGDAVVVAVIDTGRRSHPDLGGNTLTSGFEFDFITDPDIAGDGGGPDPNAFDVGDGDGLVPSSFHGTHVAGTIAALTDSDNTSANLGVAGVASIPVGTPAATSRVKVVHLRVLGQGGGTDADLARAIRYAAGLSNPGITPPAEPFDVINMSLGAPGPSQTVQNAITAARNRGLTLFAAAGNENSSEPSFPAAFAGVVSVAAVDRNAVRASYSNFHPTVDLCAPGGDTTVDTDGDGYVDGVLSTLIDAATGDPIFVFYQGTSMACPHAAGLAALMKVVAPALSPAEIESKLAQTATDLGAPGRDSRYGDGLVNALLAVQSAGTGGSATPVLALNPTALNFGTTATALTLALLNLGGGSIDVQTLIASEPWLDVDPGAAGSGIDIGSVSVTVDRGHPDLSADGTFTATIDVDSDSGSAVCEVSVVVDSTLPPDVDLFVLAVPVIDDDLATDDEGFLIVDGLDIVNPSTGLDYQLSDTDPDGADVPGGDYVVFASTDLDDDGVLCEDDDWCGFYPTLNQLALVRVDGDVAGIDFAVQPGQFTPRSAMAPAGAISARPLRIRRR